MITAIDPGTEKSAVLTLNGGVVTLAQIIPNEEVLAQVRNDTFPESVAIEMIACYGMPVGREVFETCLFIGRLQEALELHGGKARLIYRRDVKLHLCGSMRAKDANIRQALIDKYGAPGTRKNPGKIYGVSSHLWSALAIADYALSTQPTH